MSTLILKYYCYKIRISYSLLKLRMKLKTFCENAINKRTRLPLDYDTLLFQYHNFRRPFACNDLVRA